MSRLIGQSETFSVNVRLATIIEIRSFFSISNAALAIFVHGMSYSGEPVMLCRDPKSYQPRLESAGTDRAFALLEQAYKDRSYYLPTYLATDARSPLRPALWETRSARWTS
jgi:hypothetical protein